MAIGIGFSGGLFGYEDYKNNAGVYGANGAEGTSVSAASDPDKVKKAGRKSSPEDCETCKNRKYKDGSDENVSFKAAAHIDPNEAGARVRGHEQEHVSNAYKKAAEKGGKVIHAGVTLHTAICPECGRSYVSGGVTDTVIQYPKDDNNKDDDKGKVEATGAGKNDDSENKNTGFNTPGRHGNKEDFTV